MKTPATAKTKKMVISKKASFAFYTDLLLFMAFLAVFLTCSKMEITKMLNGDPFGGPAFFLLLPWFFVQGYGKGVMIGGQKIVIDKEQKIVEVTNFFLRTKREFHFTDFDGYSTGRMKRSKGGYDKVGWLVRNGKLDIRLDELYLSNMPELEVEIKELRYVGWQNLSIEKRFRMMFVKVEAEKGSDS